jgi:hypothetical protein
MLVLSADRSLADLAGVEMTKGTPVRGVPFIKIVVLERQWW